MSDLIVSKLLKYDLIVKEDVKIYEYGLFVLLFNLSSVLIALCTGIILNEFQFCAYTLLLYIPIRMLLGGYHCQTPKTCFIFFECFFMMLIFLYKIGLINKYMMGIEYIFLIIFLHNLIISDKKILKAIVLLLYYFVLVLVPVLKPYFIYSILMNEILYLLDIILKMENRVDWKKF